jgi:hypothetical protein
MISVKLGLIDTIYMDVTQYLDEDTNIILTQQLERDAFERVVDNIQLKLSNIDFVFSEMFTGLLSSDQIRVEIYSDTRIIFRGEIDNESATFDEGDLWWTVDVFSLLKIFFDRVKCQKIKFPTSMYSYPVTDIFLSLSETLERFVLFDNLPYKDLYKTIVFKNGYGDRNLRFGGEGGLGIGNAGRYVDLDPNTTAYDMLTAFATYYNAEFLIDPETESLVMQRRFGTSGTTVDVAEYIEEDVKPEVVFVDRVNYDWLHAIININYAPPPVFDKFTTIYLGRNGTDVNKLLNPTSTKQKFYYYTTSVFADGTETAPSLPLEVDVPASNLQDPLGGYNGNGVTIRVPHPSTLSSALITRLYRTDIYETESQIIHTPYAHLLYEFNFENSPLGFMTFNDDGTVVKIRTYTRAQLPSNNSPIPTSGWMAYDETLGKWSILPDIYGFDPPIGKIFEVLPSLSFISPNGWQSYSNETNIFSFFAYGYSFKQVQEDFLNLLTTKRAIKCSVAKTNFRIGDAITGIASFDSPFNHSINYGQNILVKKASINITTEITELELVCL